MKYFCEINGKCLGPVCKTELFMEGLKPDTEVCPENSDRWLPAANVPELCAMLNFEPVPGTDRMDYNGSIRSGIDVSIGEVFLFHDYMAIVPTAAVAQINAGITGLLLQKVFGAKRNPVNDVRLFMYEEITEFTKGFMANFTIKFTGDRKCSLSFTHKKRFMAEINARRLRLGMQPIPIP